MEELGDNEFLEQWFCALSVFPKLDWNLMLALGHAIGVEHYSGCQMSFESLLLLTKLSYLRRGTLPDDVRLELLAVLFPKVEYTARKVIISMLEEIRKGLTESQFAFEFLQYRLLINKSVLYTHDSERYKHLSRISLISNCCGITVVYWIL